MPDMSRRSMRKAPGTRWAVFVLAAGLLSAGCGGNSSLSRDGSPSRVGAGERGSLQRNTVLNLEGYLAAAEREWGFQGCVLVARGDKVIFKKGTGTADRKEGIPNTPRTKFLIASVTKVFTAAAVMKLAEEDRIRLENPAFRYLPGFEDMLGGEITISHLLSHASGLPRLSLKAAAGMGMGEPVNPRDLVATLRGGEPFFPPGRDARYSNAGYVLLGLIIEEVTGEGYYDWIEGHILGPLGMKDTGMAADYSSREDFARGYHQGGRGELLPAPFVHPSWGYSAGALYSTVEDLYRWDRALASTELLRADTLEEMFRPRNRFFSFGWLPAAAFGRRSLSHGGGAPGYGAWIERWPDDDLFAALLCNVTGMPVGEMGRSLAAIVFGEDYEIPLGRTPLSIPAELLEEFTGFYERENGDLIAIVHEGDSLIVERQGSRFPIRPFARDSFFPPADKGAFFRFVRDEKGRVSGLISHEQGRDLAASKNDGE
jgi:CubicO group peptidase (beta-lactamase class C family)